MRNIVLLFIFSFLTIVAMADGHDGPHLKLDRTAHNFGDVGRKDGNITTEFAFINDGDAPLVITRIVTSCSCIKAAYPKRPVKPGQSSVFKITYEPHKSEEGVFSRVIQIYSNSTDGRCIVTVRGNSIDNKRR